MQLVVFDIFDKAWFTVHREKGARESHFSAFVFSSLFLLRWTIQLTAEGCLAYDVAHTRTALGSHPFRLVWADFVDAQRKMPTAIFQVLVFLHSFCHTKQGIKKRDMVCQIILNPEFLKRYRLPDNVFHPLLPLLGQRDHIDSGV